MLRDVTSRVHSGGVLTLTSIQSWPGLKFARLQTVAATLFTRIGKNNITIVVQNEERVKSIGAFVRSLEPCKFCCLFSTTFVFRGGVGQLNRICLWMRCQYFFGEAKTFTECQLWVFSSICIGKVTATHTIVVLDIHVLQVQRFNPALQPSAFSYHRLEESDAWRYFCPFFAYFHTQYRYLQV